MGREERGIGPSEAGYPASIYIYRGLMVILMPTNKKMTKVLD